MKIKNTMKLFIFSLITLLCSPKNEKKLDSKHKLTIEIQGVSSKKGNILIALYTNKNEFASKTDTHKNKIQAASSKVMVFDNLDSESYAFAVFHDENNNGIMDKNFFGVPTEKYGFSNNARETFSAPSFKAASFEVKSDKKVSVILK